MSKPGRSTSKTKTTYEALQGFAESVKAKLSTLTRGEPEDQLRAPFENFMRDVADVLRWKIVCTGETLLPGRRGKPDFAIELNRLLAGYVELKAPGVGANTKRFSGRNREQWNRFKSIPNLIYCDGNEWALYRVNDTNDKPVKLVRLSGDLVEEGKKAVTEDDARAVENLIRDFLQWEPIIPTDRKGKIDLRHFAELLAPLCRMLREDVADALQDQGSPLVQLARDWRQLLFPDAPDEQFSDAYAQTVTFALLLGRSEGAHPLTLKNAEAALAADHNLLSRALQVLTDPNAQAEISASLNLLLRVIAEVPPKALSGPEDPWIYFYEDFLASYDPKLRKDAGAYYTPVEVVHAQVRLIDELLVNRLGKPLGFADPGVVTLDPAVGTGTYLLGVIEHALNRVEAEQGKGAVAGQATALAASLYGFELMVGPYAVSELRVSRALRDRGASLPKDGTHIYLTDTLESPHAEPPYAPLILKPIADQHRRALNVKDKISVIVCLGNPPYDRHEAVDPYDIRSLAKSGGWVRFGDEFRDIKQKEKNNNAKPLSQEAQLKRRESHSILHSGFIQSALDRDHGVHIKNLYNLYVYFWRWALWKVFERKTDRGPGVVSFISASSYLDGDAFCGMREHLRRLCDEVWILDLGGEGRGTRKSDNVFAIQTPVAIAIAVRTKRAKQDKPARIRYARIEGKRDAKLAALDAVTDFGKVKWQDCPADWEAPFRPAGGGDYFAWPLLKDLLPWQHSGVQLKRTWPIGPDRETLEHRWRSLLHAENRSDAFRGTGDREVDGTYHLALAANCDSTPIAKLPKNAPMPEVQRYAYRSLDRHCIIADGRLMSRARPDLWRAHGDRQLYLTSAFTQALSFGPALTACAHVPDLHYFSGRGAKDVVPLFRAADASEANVLPGLLDLLGKTYKGKVSEEDFVAFIYGMLAQPSFTVRFHKELESRELRVPITKDASLFKKARDLGARLLWLHTYGERYVPEGVRRGHVPRGAAKCVKAVPGVADGYPESFEYNDATRTLHVGEGEFTPVGREVFDFEVSGLKVVQSWLKYRMKKGAGKKSSPLDDIRPERWTSQFTTELLELLWVLEATVAIYPEQAKLLDAVFAGPCFNTDELPPVPDYMRKPPAIRESGGDLFDAME
jgi:hypothetical protein